jgi:hypothetical protein
MPPEQERQALIKMRRDAAAEGDTNLGKAKRALWALDDEDAAKVVIERLGLSDGMPQTLGWRMRNLVARRLISVPPGGKAYMLALTSGKDVGVVYLRDTPMPNLVLRYIDEDGKVREFFVSYVEQEYGPNTRPRIPRLVAQENDGSFG